MGWWCCFHWQFHFVEEEVLEFRFMVEVLNHFEEVLSRFEGEALVQIHSEEVLSRFEGEVLVLSRS